MAVSTAALVSLTDTKTFLGVSGTTSDARIESLIDAWSDRIERLCSRQFVARAYTTRVSGSGTENLLLPQRPVSAIGSVTMIYGAGTQEITTAIQSTEYRADLERGILYRLGGAYWNWNDDAVSVWSAGFKNYQVVYTAGYASSSIPADLQLIAKECIAGSYFASGGVNPNVKSESLGDYSYAVGDGTTGVPESVANDPIAGHIMSRLARWAEPAIGSDL
jgi:uncharacterized phiE125 gp8 family phage protein